MGMHRYFNDDYSGTINEPTYAELKEVNGVLLEALKFYRKAWQFKVGKKRAGLEYYPSEELLNDCGNIALEAIKRAEAN